jgi:hypothetical protein
MTATASPPRPKMLDGRRVGLPPSRDCESGDRERQRSEAGSERPPVPMQDAGTGPAGTLLLLFRSEDATGVGRDVRIVVRSDSGNEARAR